MFVNLHNHSYYSLLDGLSSPEEYVERAVELGQKAIALTDHGETSGLYRLQKKAIECGIKPILGTEFYFHDDRVERRGHLLALAKTQQGLRNMFKLQELAHKNIYYKPRINFDMLSQYSEGLIITSACLGNQIPQSILEGDLKLAEQFAREFKAILGDDFYLEIQPERSLEQSIVNREITNIAKRLNIELVATSDAHYAREKDGVRKQYKNNAIGGHKLDVEFSNHDILLAMQVKKNLNDETRFMFDSGDYYLKTREQMAEGIKSISEELLNSALDNTVKIAEQCNALMEKGHHLPHFHTLDGVKEEDLLMDKLKEASVGESQETIDQINKEYNVIVDEGYAGYFLIVADYIQAARDRGVIVGPGRGSGVGSMVAYKLGITQVRPDTENLLFERFLSHGRVPDIDSDFSDIGVVYKYLQQQYGEDSVARIRTFGTLRAKAVTRRVLTAYGHDQKFISRGAGLIPDVIGITLEEAYDMSQDLQNFAETYPMEWETMLTLEGVISHAGTHAGGIIIYPNLSSMIPTISNATAPNDLIAALDMNELEELGFFKFDCLGLETLNIIGMTVDNIRENHGVDIDIANLDMEDDRVYQKISDGKLLGVFQLEDQVSKVVEQQPKNFKDLIAINALIRPGIGNWSEYIKRRETKDFDKFEARNYYMDETEHIITYQEQYLLDCLTYAGWDIAFSDRNIRKNKNIKEDADIRELFFSDSIKNGFDVHEVEEVWREIEDAVSGGYGFNKSHSAAYAKITYITAWLATYYPRDFYAALLTFEDKKDKADVILPNIIGACEELGIEIHPPNINTSEDKFASTKEGIEYKITSLKHVGDSAYKEIENVRPIKSLEDLIERASARAVNKRVLTNLVKAGCFDFQDENRVRLLNIVNEAKATSASPYEEIDETMWSKDVKRIMEKQSYGFYLTTHPTQGLAVTSVDDVEEGEEFSTYAEVMEVKEVFDRNGKKMAFASLSNHIETLEAVIFSYIWQRKNIRDTIKEGKLVLVRGKKSGKDMLLNFARSE